MKWFLLIALLTVTLGTTATPVLAAPDDTSCKVVALDKESRGEPLAGSRAVLDVIENRMRMDKQTACQVISRPGQFPWKRKINNLNHSVDMVLRYERVNSMKPVLNKQYYYFNTTPHSFGKGVTKIGRHYFTK